LSHSVTRSPAIAEGPRDASVPVEILSAVERLRRSPSKTSASALTHGKLMPRIAQHGAWGSAMEPKTQKTDAWTKLRRGAPRVKPGPAAPPP